MLAWFFFCISLKLRCKVTTEWSCWIRTCLGQWATHIYEGWHKRALTGTVDIPHFKWEWFILQSDLGTHWYTYLMLTVNFIQQRTNIFHKYPNQFQQRKKEISWKCHEVKQKLVVIFFMLIFGAYNVSAKKWWEAKYISWFSWPDAHLT